MACLVLAWAMGSPAAAPGAGGPGAKIAFLKHSGEYWQVWVLGAGETEARQVTRSPGDKTKAVWFPDGRRLLITALGGQVAVVDPEAGTERALTLDGRACHGAVLSPDGTKIACSRPEGPETPYEHAIWVLELETGAGRQLTFRPGMEHEPAWHPDGSWVYFAAGSGGDTHDLWRVSPDGSRREQLSAGPRYWLDPAAAADGTLAYASNQTGGDYEIWIRPPAGPAERLTHHPGLDAHPDLARDGSRLVFERVEGAARFLWRWTGEAGAERIPGTEGGRRPALWQPPEVRP